MDYYDSHIYTNIQLSIADGKIDLSDKQPSFGLLYVVPESVALQSLMLDMSGIDTSYALRPYGEADYPPESTEAPQ